MQLENIWVDTDAELVKVNFTPTIPHCSMATLIGLSIRVKLLRSLPPRYKVSVTPPVNHCACRVCSASKVVLVLSTASRCAGVSCLQVEVRITPGSHQSETALNKQLNDKERVAAALENGNLLEMVNKCVAHTDKISLL
jgi:metal-sulfur cluster biosynthetic enzyme